MTSLSDYSLLGMSLAENLNMGRRTIFRILLLSYSIEALFFPTGTSLARPMCFHLFRVFASCTAKSRYVFSGIKRFRL